MNIALISLHNSAYQPLADLTWDQNKVPYAELHGYSHSCKTEADGFYGVQIGYEKIYFIRDLMRDHPEIDWFWWTGCDAMITNFTIKAEDIIDNRYHFIISSDTNGINSDSFFIRNSLIGREYIDFIISKWPQYQHHHWYEQQCIIDYVYKFMSIMKIVPQKLINSYDYKLYPAHQTYWLDKLETDGQWTPGDFVIQWPGTGLDHRIKLAKHYSNLIVK